MTDKVRLGDVGTIFEATLLDNNVAVDLTGQTVLELVFRKPSGARVTKTAALSGAASLGIIKYTTIAGDLDETGSWSLQAHITIPAGDFRSEIGDFLVEPKI